jgi:hypothetical protein
VSREGHTQAEPGHGDPFRRNGPFGAPNLDAPSYRSGKPHEKPERLCACEHDQRRSVCERKENHRPEERRHAIGRRAAGVEAIPRAGSKMTRVANRDQRVVDRE